VSRSRGREFGRLRGFSQLIDWSPSGTVDGVLDESVQRARLEAATEHFAFLSPYRAALAG
jgi:hypothetical protein